MKQNVENVSNPEIARVASAKWNTELLAANVVLILIESIQVLYSSWINCIQLYNYRRLRTFVDNLSFNDWVIAFVSHVLSS